MAPLHSFYLLSLKRRGANSRDFGGESSESHDVSDINYRVMCTVSIVGFSNFAQQKEGKREVSSS